MSYEEPPEYGDNARYWEERCRRLEYENARLHRQLANRTTPDGEYVVIPVKTAIRCLHVVSQNDGPGSPDAAILKTMLRFAGHSYSPDHMG
jgi:hypothetical protein